MSTTAKTPKPLRMSRKAELVPEARLEEWYALAIQTKELSELDRAILDVICDWHRRMRDDGYAGRITFEKMAHHIGAEPMSIRSSLARLVGFALIAIKPGGGQRPNEYLMALPRRLVASMATAAVKDDVPQF
jgi:hypothetical protein